MTRIYPRYCLSAGYAEATRYDAPGGRTVAVVDLGDIALHIESAAAASGLAAAFVSAAAILSAPGPEPEPAVTCAACGDSAGGLGPVTSATREGAVVTRYYCHDLSACQERAEAREPILPIAAPAGQATP